MNIQDNNQQKLQVACFSIRWKVYKLGGGCGLFVMNNEKLCSTLPNTRIGIIVCDGYVYWSTIFEVRNNMNKLQCHIIKIVRF